MNGVRLGEGRKQLHWLFFFFLTNHCIFLLVLLFHCLPKWTIKNQTEAIKSELGASAGKVKQWPVLRSLPSNKLATFIVSKVSSSQSCWQGCLPNLGKEDQRMPVPEEWGALRELWNVAPCLNRDSWRTGSTRAAKGHQHHLIKRPWASQIHLKYQDPW